MPKTKVINLYGGPGTGKSTTAACLFGELKLRGVNCEYAQEYAKDKAWEFGANHIGTPKVFQAQEYIFGKQHFRLRRSADDVELMVTDCPLFLGLIYMPEDFPMPSLRATIREGYDMYDNLNIFLVRSKPYNPKGRFQDEDQAKGLDGEVLKMLEAQNVPYHIVQAGWQADLEIIDIANQNGWSLPQLSIDNLEQRIAYYQARLDILTKGVVQD
jgi:nicotinamide riboside kinase